MNSAQKSPEQKLQESLASGLMEVQTCQGKELREIEHFDSVNMLRIPHLRDGEMHVPTIGGDHYIVRTE